MGLKIQDSLDFLCAQRTPIQIIKHENKNQLHLKKFEKPQLWTLRGSCEHFVKIVINKIYKENHNTLN